MAKKKTRRIFIINNNIGPRLKKLREKAGKSIFNVATELGIDADLLERFELSEAFPTREVLDRICRTFKKKDIYFLSDEPLHELMVGELIRIHRKKKKMNQVQVADLMSISPIRLSDIERNRLLPSIDNLVVLCEALSIKYNVMREAYDHSVDEGVTNHRKVVRTSNPELAAITGKNLSDIMMATNTNNRQLAKTLDVSLSCVNAWKRGATKPHGPNQRRLEKYFNVYEGWFEDDHEIEVGEQQTMSDIQENNEANIVVDDEPFVVIGIGLTMDDKTDYVVFLGVGDCPVGFTNNLNEAYQVSVLEDDLLLYHSSVVCVKVQDLLQSGQLRFVSDNNTKGQFVLHKEDLKAIVRK